MRPSKPTPTQVLKGQIERLFSQGRYGEIITLCARAVESLPDLPSREEFLDYAHRANDLFNERSIERGLSGAIRNLRVARKRSVGGAVDEVKDLIREKRYEEAEKGAEEILRLDPENWKASQLLQRARKAEAVSVRKEKILSDLLRRSKEAVAQRPGRDGPEETTQTAKVAALALRFVSFWKGLFRRGPELVALRKGVSTRRVKERLQDLLVRISLLAKKARQRMTETAQERLRRKTMGMVAGDNDNAFAAKLHKDLAPRITEYTLPGFEVWGEIIEADAIGGDAFNFIQRDPDNILFYIADASGHGVKASLLAARINYYVARLVENRVTLHDLAAQLNESVRKAKSNDESFATMLLFNWNLRAKVLSFVGCGHEHFIIVRSRTGAVEHYPAGGIAIGMTDDISAHLEERQVKIEDGDELILYSDGVIEAAMKHGNFRPYAAELLGLQAFEGLIATSAGDGRTVHEQVKSILESIGAKSYQRDDVTLLVLRRKTDLDLEYEAEAVNMESVDLESLKKLARRFRGDQQDARGQERTMQLLLELDNLMARGEYAMVVMKAMRAIQEEKIYHPRFNDLIKDANKLLEKEQERHRKDLVASAIIVVKEEIRSGEYQRAKMTLLRVANMDPKNHRILYLLRKLDALIKKYGDRKLVKESKTPAWMQDIAARVNDFIQPVRHKDVLAFFIRLSSLINAGIRLKEALIIILKQSKRHGLRAMLAMMIVNLEKGFLLSYSMMKYRPLFSPLQINLVKAGEESGNLGTIMEEISHDMQASSEMRRKITGAMVYPAFIILFCVLLIIGMLIFIVPKLAEAYADAGLQLPLPTRMMIVSSDAIVAYGHYGLIVLALVLVGAHFYRRTLKGKLLFDRITLKIPVYGQLVRDRNIYLFGNSLAMLVDSGILLLASLGITADVADNLLYKRDIIRVRNEITNGRSFSTALGLGAVSGAGVAKRENPYFPLEVAQMVQVGETTGQMSKMLKNVAISYQAKLLQFVKDFSTLIEPVLIVLVGLMVGGLVLSIMLPFFQFGEVVKGQ